MGSIKILIADDHAVVREGTRQILERESDPEVAAEAAWRVGQQVQEVARQAARPESPNSMASMLSQTRQPYLSQALAQMFGMFGGL